MINPPMQYSLPGEDLTKSFETCELTPYQDEAGVWTDGWGNTHGVVPGGPEITQEKADADLLANCRTAIQAVNGLVDVEVSQAQFDALVDFAFNCGIGAFSKSTLLNCVNAKDWDGADHEFGKWINAGGHASRGLVRRRAAEAQEFES